MIIMNIKKMTIPAALRHIDTRIKVGMQKGVEVLAKAMQKDARTFLEAAIAASGGHSAGILTKAIITKPGDTGQINIARYDLIVDTARAPYAAWVEFGRYAPVGLPYSRKGGKDYTQSKFKGHNYLRKTLEKYSAPIESNTVIAHSILKAFGAIK